MKPTKKQIDGLARKLLAVFFESDHPKTWDLSVTQDDWRRVAKYVLTEHLSVLCYAQWKHFRDCKASELKVRKKPKVMVCRLVKGKVVCS